MPDLTYHPMAVCEDLTAHVRKVPDRPYTLHFNPATGWDCTCPGFKYRHTCKHVKEAESTQCNYMELIDGPPTDDDKCPKCGRPVHYQMTGV